MDVHNARVSDMGGDFFIALFLGQVDKWTKAIGELDSTGELPEEIQWMQRSAKPV